MTHEEKINYMRIAANILCLALNQYQMDLLVSLYELIEEKEGNTAVDDMVRVQYEVKERISSKAREVTDAPHPSFEDGV